MATIADSFIAHYESEDFLNDYKYQLHEQFQNNEGDILRRIGELFNLTKYDVEERLNWTGPYLERDQVQKIYNFLAENLDEFITVFRSCYVGAGSLDSVSFGEQEEQLTGIYNHRTKGVYSLKYMQKVCSDAGFTVNDRGDYAYYNLDGGLQVNLFAANHLLIPFLKTLNA